MTPRRAGLTAMKFGYLVAMPLLACGTRTAGPPPPPATPTPVASPDAGAALASADCTDDSAIVVAVDSRYNVFICCSTELGREPIRPARMWVGSQRAKGVGVTGLGHARGLVDRLPAV